MKLTLEIKHIHPIGLQMEIEGVKHNVFIAQGEDFAKTMQALGEDVQYRINSLINEPDDKLTSGGIRCRDELRTLFAELLKVETY